MWYRTGTVTLKKGTNKVLGVNTKWLDKLSNVETGQPLIINGNIYEITEVRSDTELYIKESALADATNSTYVIMSVVYGSLGDVALKASKALAHYQEQMDVFDMMYTGTQPFTVTKQDGSQIEMYPYSMLSVNLAQINDAIQKATISATNAKASETSAKNSATSATTSAANAKTSETNAKTSETNAKNSETASKTSETNAKNSAAAAATSATNAKTSETNAKNYADSVNANTLLSKDDNLKSVSSLAEAQSNMQIFKALPDLTASDNLNNLWQTKDVGVRSVITASSILPENNYPVNLTGVLIVSNGAGRATSQMYITYTGRVFIRFVLSINPIQWREWTELANLTATNSFTAQIPITFDRDLASYMLSRKLDGKYRTITGLISNGTDIPFILRRYNENGTAASQLELGTDGQARLLNLIANKSITVTNDGKYTTSEGEIFHVGNAGTGTGIGATFTRFSTSGYNIDAKVAGPTLDASLPGTWQAMKMSIQTINGVNYYVQSFKRVS